MLSAANGNIVNNINSHLHAWFKKPFYFGPILGWGSTDWSMIVANCDPKSSLYEACTYTVNIATPIAAGDSGFVWGFTVGYEIQPHFAIEANFFHFPNTTIYFNTEGNNYIDNGLISSNSIVSKTYTYNIVGKFMVQIENTGIRGFANAGAAFTHRCDSLNTQLQATPTFGVGLNYVFFNSLMIEGSFQYTAGYGKSNLTPAVDYIPFLYSLNVKITYRV